MSFITVLLIVFVLLAAYHYFNIFVDKKKLANGQSKEILFKSVVPALILTIGVGISSYYGAESYLYSNPETVEKAKELAEIQKNKEKIDNLMGDLVSENAPKSGNLDGDITVVKFFDYNCGYCRMTHAFLKEAAESDGNVKIVYKHMPIFGAVSLVPHQAAVAAYIYQDHAKADKFHELLMTNSTRPDKKDMQDASEEKLMKMVNDKVMGLAEKAGLDVNALKKQMKEEAVAKEIASSMEVASQLGISGTPAFIFEDKLVKGAVRTEQMKEEIKAARERN